MKCLLWNCRKHVYKSLIDKKKSISFNFLKEVIFNPFSQLLNKAECKINLERKVREGGENKSMEWRGWQLNTHPVTSYKGLDKCENSIESHAENDVTCREIKLTSIDSFCIYWRRLWNSIFFCIWCCITFIFHGKLYFCIRASFLMSIWCNNRNR